MSTDACDVYMTSVLLTSVPLYIRQEFWHNSAMPTRIEPFYRDVGQSIRHLRGRRGITQEQLGRLLSPPTTRVSVANIEGGHQRILAHTLVQLAAALSVDVMDILPKQSQSSISANNSAITDELVTKLGMSVSVAKALAKKAEPT